MKQEKIFLTLIINLIKIIYYIIGINIIFFKFNRTDNNNYGSVSLFIIN